MATKRIRIGSLKNIHQYDDGDYNKSIEVEDPIKCTGAPTDLDDLAKVSDLSDAVEDLVEGPASATDSNLAEFDGTTGKKIKDGGLSHVDTADAISKKHDRQHALNSASDHTGTITDAQHGTRTQASAHAHSHLSGVGANDHHNQSHAATHVTGGGDTVANVIAAGNSGLMSGADKTKLDGVESSADVTDATNVAAAGAVMDADFTAADEVMVGTGAGTHGQVTLAASQFLAKKAAGAVTNVTATEARTILNVEDGAEANNISDGDATNLTNGGDTILHDHAGISENTAARHTQGTDTALGVLGTKATPVNADKIIQRDSANSDAVKTSTWTQIKAFLKTYFDTLYNNYTLENHASNHTDGTDNIQSATNGQKGVATAAHITAIEANTSHSSGDGSDHADVASAMQDLSNDTTPQLGGNLDLQTNKIVGDGGSTGIYVDSDGRVGVGGTTPVAELDIDKAINIGGHFTKTFILDGGTISNNTIDVITGDTNRVFEIVYVSQSYNAGNSTNGWRYVKWHGYDGSGGGGEGAGDNFQMSVVETSGTGESSHTPTWSTVGSKYRLTYGGGYMTYRMLVVKLYDATSATPDW